MNIVTLIGRLTTDPEIRTTETNNMIIANFSLAVNRRFVKEGEERQADFIRIVGFGKTAEFIQKYYKKGQQVAIQGRIQTRTWDDDQGQKHYATEVIAEQCFFADSKKDNTEGQTDFTNTVAQAGIAVNEFASADDLPF